METSPKKLYEVVSPSKPPGSSATKKLNLLGDDFDFESIVNQIRAENSMMMDTRREDDEATLSIAKPPKVPVT